MALESINVNLVQTDQTEDTFEFRIPPEAPVFEPSHEEFQDPLLYINKIRHIAEKTGICKIKPPADWQPPFAVDIDKFKFTPRVQRLNELEAKTRIKLNFLDQIAKFWELQGSTLKIPMVERRILDLYTLHQIVQDEGGATNVTKERKWSKVAVRLGMPSGKGIGAQLKSHYERILFPFDVFQQSKINEMGDKTDNEKNDGIADKAQSNLHKILQKTSSQDRKSVRLNASIDEQSKCPEFCGAGTKMAGGFNPKKEEKIPNKTRGKKLFIECDPLAKYVCRHCQRGDIEESMLLCDGCDDSYHTFCLMPPLLEIPKGDWRCPSCVAAEVYKPTEAFGFEQAQREYTLHQFGEMADQFKSDYFNMPVHRVPTYLVEKEFWRIVSSLDEDVTVEYGADLHTMEHGSGFPTKNLANLANNPLMAQYAESSWNLNNLPVLEGSVLAYINADISGMKVPWMYVGMCFATFCWHNEDHWSYSINYLHWGEPKTWYGVPGGSAEDFEEAMKKAAPELFHSQPDLLHQLVTIMNPNVLMDNGVPVYRTDQHAGEFVITFPRSYHAGFNQGYNFAEAVNFAPSDWLKMGRECISHYSSLHRYCVFSHDELVCKMAVHSDSLDPRIAAATYQDMLQMVESEKKLRKSLLEWGVCDAEREAFELLPDDERQCELCKTTCFLSAVTCSCSTSKLVCLRHYTYLCECPPKKHTLRYRYTLDELPIMLQKLKLKAESFDAWVLSVKDVLDCTTPKTLDLEELKGLLTEAEEKKFPESELLQALGLAIQEAEKCSTVARQLENNRLRIRTRVGQDCKLTAEELVLFNEQIEGLACKIKEADSIKSWVNEVQEFNIILQSLLEDNDLEKLEKTMETGLNLGVRFYHLPKLNERILQLRFIYKCEDILKQETINIKEISVLLNNCEDIPITFKIDQLRIKLKNTLSLCHQWEQMTTKYLNKSLLTNLEELELHLNEGKRLKCSLSSISTLESAISQAKDWNNEAQKIFENEPSCIEVQQLVEKSIIIPVNLPLVQELKNIIKKADMWLECTKDIFLKDDSEYSLMQVLCPRLDKRNMSDRTVDSSTSNIFKFRNLLTQYLKDTSQVISIFGLAQKEEVANVKKVQLNNIHKKLNVTKESSFCLCQNHLTGPMVECSLCRDWFHESCVRELQSLKGKTDDFGCDLKFICPYCSCSKRPSVETIISLLLALNKLHLKIPEGEALRYLMDRIIDWQTSVKQTLKNEEMVRALGILERRRKMKIKVPSLNSPSDDASSQVIQKNSSMIWHVVESQAPPEEQSYHQEEHTYSAASRSTSIKKHYRKSPIVPRLENDDDYDGIITLSKNGIISLKELLNEGGLIEATLDECQTLWCLLQASVPHQVWRDFGKSEVNIVQDMETTSNNKSKGFPTKRSCETIINSKKKLKSSSKTKTVAKPSKRIKEEISTKSKRESREECAAKQCLHPSTRKVDWVQCDGGCDRWFHMHCVGLSKKDIKKDDEYSCSSCTSLKKRKTKEVDIENVQQNCEALSC